MYDIAEKMEQWQQGGLPAVVARTVALRGFGTRTEGEALAIAGDGSQAGSLLEGTVSAELQLRARALLAQQPGASNVVEIAIGDREAIAAGLACGGVAEIVLQASRTIPAMAWQALRSGRRIGLATALPAGGSAIVDGAGSEASTLTGESEAAAMALAREALSQAKTSSRVVEQSGARFLVEAFVPVSHLVVVGRAILADALQSQGDLLGWQTHVVDGLEESAAAIDRLGLSDALVLLTHDKEIDAPLLARALRQGVGYVGALGSRTTQGGRRERLRGLGLTEEQVGKLHGPVGLDIGASTPAETAVSIFAEILAHKSGHAAQALTGTTAPLHG